MEKIGIGISTFNRPDILDLSLSFFKKYSNSNNKIFVCDDGSKESNRNQEICSKYRVNYYYQLNSGISKTKNKCIENLDDSDHIFLFDDDTFPIKEGWEKVFIDLNRNTGNHHLLLMYNNSSHAYIGDGQNIGNNLSSYSGCGGTLSYFDKLVLQTCGGYYNQFMFYGFEHVEFSYRVNRAGLTPNGCFLTATNAREYFCILDYGVDIDNPIFNENNKNTLRYFSSSINTDPEKAALKDQSISNNLGILGQCGGFSIYQDYK